MRGSGISSIIASMVEASKFGQMVRDMMAPGFRESTTVMEELCTLLVSLTSENGKVIKLMVLALTPLLMELSQPANGIKTSKMVKEQKLPRKAGFMKATLSAVGNMAKESSLGQKRAATLVILSMIIWRVKADMNGMMAEST